MTVSNVTLSCGASSPPWDVRNSESVVSRGARSSLSPTGDFVVAVCLGFIGTFGFLNNLLVLTLFCRFRALRSPINVLLVSVCVSDLLVCVLGTPFSFAAATQGRWLIGRAGCVWYGFINACLGIVSLISLAVLSYERYCTMMCRSQAGGSDFGSAVAGVCFSWLYSLAWTLPPLLGWSSYGPEGPGTTCSVDWRTQTPNNISYILSLFTFCLLLPFSVILYSYCKLLRAINQVSSVRTTVTRRREQRVLVMVVTMVACYLVCWLPYGVAALLATFGPCDLLTPEVTIVPSLLAKTSTVINPSSIPSSRIHGDSELRQAEDFKGCTDKSHKSLSNKTFLQVFQGPAEVFRSRPQLQFENTTTGSQNTPDQSLWKQRKRDSSRCTCWPAHFNQFCE
ncbi:hypothetical protein DPEC_G00078430 [Dallia pectoralis]|uniref:Uncharacterized protein n=1 Tax=Dallia pectoralis TaxID=75939 RepID=A0ACC2H441_DALPE|nr:hypothetical protein DPEC_G00078430 [Dallia pectoralis]